MVTHEVTCHIIVIKAFPKNFDRYTELKQAKNVHYRDKLDKIDVKVQGHASMHINIVSHTHAPLQLCIVTLPTPCNDTDGDHNKVLFWVYIAKCHHNLGVSI